ncbi:MAG: penicillin-binding transpeptidase domain-containing protein [Patescibacteria group bacterium]|nr:penicillin-binding transpeptidase domain-containing protein [Patescibacteria group bacterium]
MSRKFFGSAFFDTVVVESKQVSRRKDIARDTWWRGSGRVLVFAVFLWGSLSILVARLFQLTIIDGYRYRVLANGNRTKELIRHAPRGILSDRAGNPLVKNIPQFRLLSPCKENPDQLCISRLSEEEGRNLEEGGLPSKHFLEVEYRREYLYPESTAHVVGYIGEVSEKELSDEYYVLREYARGDSIGRTGSESVFEDRLRGRNGRELVEVDAHGRIVRVLGRDPEIPGEDMVLSLDAELSQTVMDAFPKGKDGAVIVSVPHTGEILALYSSPTFSLNDFSLGMTDEAYKRTFENPRRPLFNRAISGVYPPASTYKLVSGLAALETGAMKKDTKIEDIGVIKIGKFEFPNWYFLKYGKTDGMVDMVKALARSNDIYFYKLGEAVGITRLREWSSAVGIGKPLGIELPGEAAGVLPGPEWKKARFTSEADIQARQNEWYLGDTYHIAIGQGYLLTTPLHVNAWTNVIANGGYLCRPTIKKIDARHQSLEKTCVNLNIKKETIDVITEGMRQACSDGGTAFPLFNFKIMPQEATSSGSIKIVPIACKTGTGEFGHPQNKTHAWITLFAPMRDESVPSSQKTNTMITGEPEISITVLVEEGGEGSDAAAPIAKKILEYWFSR